MLTKAEIKLINQLKLKKHRKKYQLFVVEGYKSVSEFLSGPFQLEKLYSIKELKFSKPLKNNFQLISETELKKISCLKTPQKCLALFKIPTWGLEKINDFHVVLDGVQDPGNLGTLIRLADWFGISHLVCSQETADVFNPKVIQASMGSLNRVQVHYTDLSEYLETYKGPVYGTFMEGENLYNQELKPEGILILGNEGNGISPEIEKFCTTKISIPQNSENGITESLNVAVAGSIIISQFFSNTLK